MGSDAPQNVRAGLSDAARDAALRERIRLAMVVEVARDGFAGASVTAVAARARVSRSSFYRLYDDLQDCFVEVIEDGYLQAAAVMRDAYTQADCWLDGVQEAFVGLMRLFDADPDLARVLLVEVLAAGSWSIEHRERNAAKLTALTTQAWKPPRGAEPHPLAVQASMSAALGLLQSHIVAGRSEPLLSLLGPLMGAVTVASLNDEGVRREVARAQERARPLISEAEVPGGRDGVRAAAAGGGRGRGEDGAASLLVDTGGLTGGAEKIPAMLLHPRARRARACLAHVAEHPGASNREIGEAIGVACRTQVSTLLARLAGLGLLEKRAAAPGRANAWRLTAAGERVVELLRSTDERFTR